MTNALFLWQRKIDLCMAFRFVYLLNTQLPMIIETDNKNFCNQAIDIPKWLAGPAFLMVRNLDWRWFVILDG